MGSRLRGFAAVALMSLMVSASGLPVAAEPLSASLLGEHDVESAWDASFGPGKGTATIRVLDTGTGMLQLSVHQLAPFATYATALFGGVCPATGSRLGSLGKFATDKTGKLSASIGLGDSDVAAIRATTAGTGRVSITVGTGSKAACATFAKSLDVTPRIWFAPLPPLPLQEWRPFIGSGDFAELFAADAPWMKAAGRTHVFKFYMEWVADGGFASDAELRRAVAALAARDIKIAIEVAPLIPPEDGSCGGGVEGFGSGAEETLAAVRRIEAAGGRVSFLALDEPYFFGSSLYDGPGACGWTAERIAADVVTFVRGVTAARPSIVIGDIEPFAGTSTAEDYETWLTAYQAAAGSPLPFFHLDVDWTRTWVPSAIALEAFARTAGTRFGVIYNGPYESPSDASWLSDARNHFVDFESAAGGAPDDAVFQSWTDHPDYVLPETSPNTFTRLIVDYTRRRTTLALAAPTVVDPGLLAISGSLATLDARGVDGAPIEVSVVPRDGPYQVLEYSGTVPAAATQAVVGLRVNLEDAGPGPADLTVYEIGYAEGSETTNRVPNSIFADGLDYWYPWGDESTFSIVTSDRDAAASMLRIVATPEQSAGSNSGSFAVTPGEPYRLWLKVRVPESSVGSTYVAPIFLTDAWEEVAREVQYLAPAPIAVGSATTTPSGSFSLTTVPLESGRYYLTASYPGDTRLWPAREMADIVVP